MRKKTLRAVIPRDAFRRIPRTTLKFAGLIRGGCWEAGILVWGDFCVWQWGLCSLSRGRFVFGSFQFHGYLLNIVVLGTESFGTL